MKKSILKGWVVLAGAFFLGCSSDDSVVQNPDIANIKLQISFTVVDMQVSDLSGKSNLSGKTNKGGTLTDKQEWEHIFEEGLAIEFTNTKTKKVYTLPYDPSNGSSDEYSIVLPFGSYSYKLESLEPNSHFSEYHNYLPFAAVGTLEVANTEVVLNLRAQTDYGLVTVDAYNIREADLRVPKYNDRIWMPYTTSKEYYYKYVKSGEAPKVHIYTEFQEALDYQLPTIRALKRYNLLLGQSELNNINFILADFEQEDYYFVGDNEQNAKTFVPDDRFEEWLIVLGYDDVMDNYVLTRNIATLKELNLTDNYLVSDLTGIQDFVALETLDIQMYNTVSSSSIDFTKNTALKSLSFRYLGEDDGFDGEEPISLDLTMNTALETLAIYRLSLSYLDVSKNTALKTLAISESELPDLDVSKNTALETLTIFYSRLSYLDVSKNTALKTLKIDYSIYPISGLSYLDVSKNTALETLVISNSKLSYLDISKNTALVKLRVVDSYKQLTCIQVNEVQLYETIPSNPPTGNYEGNWLKPQNAVFALFCER